jgi:HAD superfamily hydrolase (TIGR01509 family)
MPDFGAIIFDFDGVLLESEYEGNRELAALLTEFGHPHEVEDTLRLYVGLSGGSFIEAIEQKISTALPPEFHDRLKEMSRRAVQNGVAAVAGAIDFVRSLPHQTPKAVASSSSTRWVKAHLDNLKIADAFADHVYSGREHVARGKPAPDLYFYAAEQLRTPIERCVIIEDSRVGATGALASGARVIGLAAGSHCLDGHGEMLKSLGVKQVAHSFAEVRGLLGLA